MNKIDKDSLLQNASTVLIFRTRIARNSVELITMQRLHSRPITFERSFERFPRTKPRFISVQRPA